MTGILFSISVALFKALWELAGKLSVDSKTLKNIDEYSLALWVRAFAVIPLMVVFLYQWVYHFESSYISLILIWAVWNAITTVTSLKAVKYGDLSLVWPLSSLTIPFLIFTGFFINGELPNTYGMIGVLCIFIGTYFLWVSGNKKSLLDPLRNIMANTGARFMILTSIIWSITAPIDKLWIQAMWVIPWLLYFNIAISLCIFLYILLYKKNIQLTEITSPSNLKKISITGFLSGAASFLQVLAIKYTLVVYVISIKRSSGIFSVLLGALFFKEKDISTKLIATIIMVIGICFIALWGNI
jgi:uncharacterized membrane protein